MASKTLRRLAHCFLLFFHGVNMKEFSVLSFHRYWIYAFHCVVFRLKEMSINLIDNVLAENTSAFFVFLCILFLQYIQTSMICVNKFNMLA